MDQKTKQRFFTLGRRAALLVTVILCAAIVWWLVKFANTMPGHQEQDASLTYATWALTLATLLLAIGVPWTIWDSSKKAREQEQDQFYAQLDRMYLEIQKLVIEHPHLADPPAPSGERAKSEHATRYDAFAFVVWNFIESIDDFTRENEASPLAATWRCIIDYEGKRHVHWLADAGNQIKFKEPFVEKMAKRFHFTAAKRPPAPAT